MIASSADIQPENGFVRIHPAILELLATRQLSGREFRCLMFLFRKTYGYQKKIDNISLSQWEQGTGIPRTRVGAVLDSLVAQKLIFKIDNGTKRPATWGFNKHFETWHDEPSVTLEGDSSQAHQDESVTPTGNSSVTLEGDSSKPSVTLEGDKSVTLQGDNNRKKESSLQQPQQDPLSAQFDSAYRRVWALVPASEYESEKIADWAKRVTLEAWEYALKEAVDNGAVGRWRYLERILLRVEREGLQNKRNGSTPPPIVPPVVSIAKPEVKPWQI